MDKIKQALEACSGIRRQIEIVEKYEEWNGGSPTYGTPQKFKIVKEASDLARAALAELEAAKPKEPPRYVMSSGLLAAVDELIAAKESADACMGRWDASRARRVWAELITERRKMTTEQPKELEAKPYAWTVSGTRSMYFGEYAEDDARAEAGRIGGTAIAFPLFRQE